MTLPAIEEQWTAVFYTKNADVPAVFGGPRIYSDITIHYWGDTTDFMTVVNTFCNGNKQTSAHYIAEAGRVACVVSPWDAAWACGNGEGNRVSISIECNPLCRDEDYQTIAELIKYLRDQYGDLPLVPHHYWVATSCPGNYDLNRLDNLARNLPVDNPTPKIEDEMVFLAKLPNDNTVYVSNGIWYRRVQDPDTLTALKNATGLTNILEVPSLNVLGVPADYIASPNFKADGFTGQTDVEKNAQANFIDRTASAVVAKLPAQSGTGTAGPSAEEIAGRTNDILLQRLTKGAQP